MTLYSLGLTLAGLVTISSTGLNAIVEYHLQGKFFIMNLSIGSVNLLMSLLCIVAVWRAHRQKRQIDIGIRAVND